MSQYTSTALLSKSLDIGLEEDETSLADIAERAHQLLLCCQNITSKESQRILGIQLDRFYLWTSNIGVFAPRHASLDYRLRSAPTIKAAVDGNLEILCRHVLAGEQLQC